MCLIEMATWYFDYLHLNNKGIRHKGPFITGLITTVTRRMVSRMLVVAVSLGFGVVKPTLSKRIKNHIIILGIYHLCNIIYHNIYIYYVSIYKY